jgi:MHS family alpha-ketoglutarate permease-like MFS transporter
VTTWLSSEGLAGYLWIYVSAAALISLLVYLRMPETKNKEFI